MKALEIFKLRYYDSNNIPSGPLSIQQQNTNSKTDFITAQTDYANPITDKLKIETGVRGAIRNYNSATENFLFNYLSNEYDFVPSEITDYKFTDQVYAGYFTLTNQFKKFGYQLGIRGESSFYTGTLTNIRP